VTRKHKPRVEVQNALGAQQPQPVEPANAAPANVPATPAVALPGDVSQLPELPFAIKGFRVDGGQIFMDFNQTTASVGMDATSAEKVGRIYSGFAALVQAGFFTGQPAEDKASEG
jgi:hypothetical protein